MISIVIPTKNEESTLPLLLKSIKAQGDIGCEIIVADSSKDETRKIATKENCIVVTGGTPAIARNNGAKIAKYNLLFLDSDVMLPKNFLKSFLEESKGYDFSTCHVYVDSKNLLYRLYYNTKNFLNKHNPSPHCSGQCMYIKKSLFEKLNGFDGSLVLGEEHDLASRAKKAGARCYFSRLFVFTSPRRIRKEGFIGLTIKSLYSESYRMLIGKIDKKIFDYDYDYI